MAKTANRTTGLTTYALIILDSDEQRINGTGTGRDLAGARRLAYELLRTVAGASTVEIYGYDAKAGGMAGQPLETVNLDQEDA